MLNPLGHDKHLRGAQRNRAIPQLDFERSFEDKKEILCLVMFVSVERPFKLGHHDVVIVVSGNSAGREAIGERSELFGEIGWCFHHFFPSVSCIMNVVADIECVTHAVDPLGPPAQIRPPIPL
jgi:hypothetical protein